jgi:hypothetical protein
LAFMLLQLLCEASCRVVMACWLMLCWACASRLMALLVAGTLHHVHHAMIVLLCFARNSPSAFPQVTDLCACLQLGLCQLLVYHIQCNTACPHLNLLRGSRQEWGWGRRGVMMRRMKFHLCPTKPSGCPSATARQQLLQNTA